MYRPLHVGLAAAVLIALLAGCAPALEVRNYPNTPWKVVYGGQGAINDFCAKRLGPSRLGRWGGCILPRERIIACSGVESCLHEAIHAADATWGPRHDGFASSTVRLPFRPPGKKPRRIVMHPRDR